MAFLCSLCGGIAVQEQGQDWPICTLSAYPCHSGEVKTETAFAEAIRILHDKGYKIIGYTIPRSDGWTDDMMAIVFNPHTLPDTMPPLLNAKDVAEVGGVAFYRYYDTRPTVYEIEVKESAIALKAWAESLPVYSFTIL
jgi:hypothetical protein